MAPSRARQLVKENDLLIATVRPNLNGVALVTADFDGATASTGYCVLRANKNKLDERYLFYWVQSVHFIRDMISKATGANYPAVSDKIIFDSKIPLPPLAEQKRIAAILDKADAIRQKRQQAIALADDFLRSIFLDMFGDPVTNP
ncbi:TPA: restriction endonuclease subunit S, partial [Aeromonas veronii]